MPVQTVTFTAASANLTNYTKIRLAPGTEAPSSDKSLMAQVLRVMARATTSSGPATIEVAWAYPSGTTVGTGVIHTETATVTAKTRRTGWDNASGDYEYDVVFARSLNDFIDIFGTGNPLGGYPELYIGCTALGGIASLTLEIQATRAGGGG